MDELDQHIINQLRQLDVLTYGALSHWNDLPKVPPPQEDKVLALFIQQGLIEPSSCATVEIIPSTQGEDL